MSMIDPLGASLYFSAAEEARRKKAGEKIQKTKKTPFSSMVEKQQELEELVSAGLPPEIAGLTEEEAVSFLKDAVDIAGDELEADMTAEHFAQFRRSENGFFKSVFEIYRKEQL